MPEVPEKLTYATVDCGVTRVYEYIRQDLVPNQPDDDSSKSNGDRGSDAKLI